MNNDWRASLLEWLKIDTSGFTWVEQLAFASIILLVIVIVDKLCNLIMHRIVFRVVRATKATWDDVLLDKKVLDKAIKIVPALLLVVLLPFVFVRDTYLYIFIQRITWLYIVGVIISTIVTALSALSLILQEKEALRNKPIKGGVQMLQILVMALGIIVMISIVINKSPLYLLTGLGASAAVLMLVFQDTILGLVAGIQLSANDMMRVGDWVVVPGKQIDGSVIEITLTTVKIQNWDYTISTIQPQALVNGSFTNWRNVFDSGGRRIARTINIDIRTVRFLTDEEVNKWRDEPLLTEYIDNTLQQIADAKAKGNDVTARSLQMTNLGMFRIYLQEYIRALNAFNADFVSMVRLMEPTANGVPMQIYFFSNQTAWVIYEGIQSSLFEHIFASISKFDLRLFQAPTGEDLRSLTETETEA